MLRHVRLRAILSGFPCEDLGLSSPGIYPGLSKSTVRRFRRVVVLPSARRIFVPAARRSCTVPAFVAPSCPRAPANAKLVTEAIPRKCLRAITALYPPPIALFERGGESPRTRLRSVGRPWNTQRKIGHSKEIGDYKFGCVCRYFKVCGALWGVLQCLQRALCVCTNATAPGPRAIRAL